MTAQIMALTTTAKLTEVEAAILAELQDEGNAFDVLPSRVKIAPGGIGQFLVGDDTAKSFVAVVAISQKIRGYWATSGTGAAPTCSSPNGMTGYFNDACSPEEFQAAAQAQMAHPFVVAQSLGNQRERATDCSTCPLSQWGSEHQRRAGGPGKGKACKEMRRLLLLIDGWAMPAIMSLPPTSIRAWDAYCSGHAAKRGAYFAVKTRFELDIAKAAGGEAYNVIKVSAAGALDIEQVRMVSAIRQQYRDLVVDMPVEAQEYATVDGASTSGGETIPY